MTSQEKPRLTDSKGLGGIIALDGFDYQLWDALARLPAWLRHPGFEGFTIEGLEDFEARFFAPHSTCRHILDRFQAKSGTLSKSELIEVLNSFVSFTLGYPDVARVHTLVTPALPPALKWITRDPNRIRRARPFYSPFSDILAASDEKLRQDLIEEFGSELGGFFADSIEVALRTFPDRNSAEITFAAAMHDIFPELDISPRKFKTAFSALTDLIAQNRGVMLARNHLLEVLDEALGIVLIPDRRLRVHVRSDRNGAVTDAIEIDANKFSGAEGVFPPLDGWRLDLLAPLEATSSWARERNRQRIALSGSYRLSTAFALGWSFRSAIGFEIDIDTRSGAWATDERPLPDALPPPWKFSWPKRLVDNRLVVAIGVLRDPSLDVKKYLGLTEESGLLIATLPTALANGVEAQACVQTLKVAVSQSVSQLDPKGIDLFFVGPAALAVTLGHRWNAMPSTQVHEFVASERHYVPTVIVG